MLKKLLFFAFLLASFLGFTQIPNPGFESVSGGAPTGWNQGPTYSLYPIRDTNVVHSGSHAVAIYGSVPPAYNGALAQSFAQASALPVSLTGWYKFYPEGGDSILFDVGVWKQGHYSTAAKNTHTITILTGTTNVFTQFNVPISYTSYTYTTCDSAYIIIYPTGNVSQGGYNWAHPNTKAIFDDLAWNMGTTTGVNEIKNLPLNAESVWPNPATDAASIVYTVAEPATVSLRIYDMTGQEVLKIVDNEQQARGRYKAVADLSSLRSGMYFYELSTASGYKVVNKLLKQ